MTILDRVYAFLASLARQKAQAKYSFDPGDKPRDPMPPCWSCNSSTQFSDTGSAACAKFGWIRQGYARETLCGVDGKGWTPKPPKPAEPEWAPPPGYTIYDRVMGDY